MNFSFLRVVKVEFDFEVPIDCTFQSKNPEYPKYRSKEWFQNNGYGHLRQMHHKQAVEFLVGNEISKVKNVKITEIDIFSKKSLHLYQGIMKRDEVISEINKIVSKVFN